MGERAGFASSPIRSGTALRCVIPHARGHTPDRVDARPDRVTQNPVTNGTTFGTMPNARPVPPAKLNTVQLKPAYHQWIIPACRIFGALQRHRARFRRMV